MSIPLDAIPSKVQQVSFHVLGLVPYPELVQIVEKMSAQDSRIIFTSMTPMADEVWNFIDGKRSVAEILESVCLEFDFDIDPTLFIPLVERLHSGRLITFNAESGVTDLSRTDDDEPNIVAY